MSVPAIELQNITKTFGHIVANKNVNLVVNRGEILSILGENGSGKTTLMNMISGIYYPDNGRILIDGEEVVIRSPKDAFRYKIGMIHQHFKLVDVFSAADNIVLGLDEKFNMKEASAKVARIAAQYGFDIDPAKKIYEMSVSEKQTVEIIKVLYRGADILILDEPTAVLTPQETEKLFSVLRRMKADGKAIIIITHKLHEVLSLSDKVAVLRKGEYIGTVETKDATETSLTEMMVGKKVSLNIDRSEPHENADRLTRAAARGSSSRRSRVFLRSPAARSSMIIRRPARRKTSATRRRCRSANSASACPLFPRTVSAWVSSATWTSSTT